MQISKFSDYAFRALIYLANHSNKLCTVEELSEQLQTSPHHMKKVIHKLASTDYVVSLKGRTGGVRLGLSPQEINLGKVLTFTEENLNIFECFTHNNCPMTAESCKLKTISHAALSKFLNEFSAYSLADIL